MIQLHHVSKTFDQTNFVLNDVSFEVNEGETLILLGSSGSGKTTALKMINRLIDPSSGVIKINNQNIDRLDPVKLRRSIGYVFQGIGLFPHLNIAENLITVLKLANKKITSEQQQARVEESLALVNLDPAKFAHRYPDELSGGQQQRVGVARALINEPAILLMDEPFGALDPINRTALQDELLQLKSTLNKTIVFVTHDIFEALRLGDRIAVMNNGKLEQIGLKHDIIHQPATPFVKQLFEQTSHQLKDFSELLDE